ncbi:hypothetical protein Tco_0831104, partial [Tanacetum coccineum]
MSTSTESSSLPIEPQSIKKLTFKSIKRSLDLFSPNHSQLPPHDPLSKKIRVNHKVGVEYDGIKTGANQTAKTSASSSSSALVLSGTDSSKKAGGQSDSAITSVQPKNLGDGSLT